MKNILIVLLATLLPITACAYVDHSAKETALEKVRQQNAEGGISPEAGSTLDGWGLVDGFNEDYSSRSGTNSGAILYETSAVADNIARIRGGDGSINIGSKTITTIKFETYTSISNAIIMAGWGDCNNTTTYVANDPDQEFIGIQYSTSRPDSNWQFMADDGTTQTVLHATGVTPAVSTMYNLVMESDGTDVRAYIYNEAGTLLDSHTFANADIKDQGYEACVLLRTLDTSTKGFAFQLIYATYNTYE